MASVCVLGFPQDLAVQLSEALAADAHIVERKQKIREVFHGPLPRAIFLDGDSPDYRDRLSALLAAAPGLPVVVATRLPHSAHWLEALEAGATDYCCAPFEAAQVRWIMDSILGRRRRLATA